MHQSSQQKRLNDPPSIALITTPSARARTEINIWIVEENKNPENCIRENEPSLFFVAVCIGTNGRMSVPNNREHHYRNLRDRYTNCTYVDGNLELTWLQDENLDLSFLQHIREVTGYVLISHVDVTRIVLPSLQIIRGRTLFKLNVQDDEFALIVTLSKMHNLELPALRGKDRVQMTSHS